jgi:sugar lactone lactonase YvrE
MLIRLLSLLAAGSLSSCASLQPSTTELPTLLAGTALHSPNGITFGPDGKLYAGSVGAQTIYRVDVDNGAIEVVVSAPAGEADDVAFSPDGTLVWTALVAGEIRSLQPNNVVTTVVSNYALINPIHFTRDGRLFAAQIGFDRLHEFPVDAQLTLTGEPRLIASKIGNLNSFEITADNRMFGPLVNLGSVAEINIETGSISTVAAGLGTVVAINLDSKGNIWAIDWVSGDLWRIDANGDAWAAPKRVATLVPPLDNLAIGADDAVYVSRPAHSAIDRVDPATGVITSVVAGDLAAPGGLVSITHKGRDALLVADGYGYRIVDTQTGAQETLFDLTGFGFPGAATAAAATERYFLLSDAVIRPNVYLVDRDNGKTIAKWRQFTSALGLLLTEAGNPLVADFESGRLVGLSRSDRKRETVLAENLAGPAGLAWAGNNAVYVAEALGNRISRIDLLRGTRTVVAENIDQPEGITVLNDGRIAVVAAGSGALLAIDPATGATTTLASDLPVNYAAANAPAPVYLPSGVTQSADGTVYISGDQDNSIRVLSSAELQR